ncbi:MAG: hypothetical protein K2N35_13780 [Muribaculaceae bacterium]|nr:hypothetical protein [Muribaculaceae bacterium]
MNDDIRKDWQGANVSIPGKSDSYDAIMNGKRKTALQNLAQRYRWFSNMALLFLLMVPLNIMNLHLFPDLKGRMVIVIWFCSFFIISSVMDRWLYHGIRQIDVVTMPVAEVVEKALYYRKWHIRFIFILLPMALGCLGLLAYFIDDIYVRLGMLAGFLVGVGAGVSQLLNFLADYRAITSKS